MEALKKGVDILIACPGRLNDLIGQGFIDLSDLEIFVLDEADRMLDMGFVHDVKKVIAKLPGERQNLMFSATMPTEIEQLAAGILRKPAFVKVDPVSSTVDRIQQSLYHVEKGNKKFLLPWLIKNLQPPVVNALVFSRTKHGADKIAKDLTKQGIPAAAIHGNKSQTARVTALEDFKAGKTKVMVATDIAARVRLVSSMSGSSFSIFTGFACTLGAGAAFFSGFASLFAGFACFAACFSAGSAAAALGFLPRTGGSGRTGAGTPSHGWPLTTGILRRFSFSMPARYSCSSGAQKLTAVPSAPARAVRPMRCT